MGAKVTVVIARGILIATILENTSEILEATPSKTARLSMHPNPLSKSGYMTR